MDDFEKPYWNLTQLLAWVYLGDRRLVQRAADGQNDHGSFLQEAVLPGSGTHYLLPDSHKELVAGSANPTSPIHLELTAAYKGGAHNSTLEDAENEAIAVLQQGRLRAIGLENDQGNPLDVPQIQWAELRFEWDPPRAVPKHVERAGASHWYNLKFVRSEVLEIWPDPLALPAGAEIQTEPLSTDASHDESKPSENDKTPSNRKHDAIDDAALRNRIDNVLVLARKKWDSKSHPGYKPMARELVRVHGRSLGFKFDTVRKILDGTYSASKRLGISGL
jgi:hypothetical protein